jgi:hypothetical protein
MKNSVMDAVTVFQDVQRELYKSLMEKQGWFQKHIVMDLELV